MSLGPLGTLPPPSPAVAGRVAFLSSVNRTEDVDLTCLWWTVSASSGKDNTAKQTSQISSTLLTLISGSHVGKQAAGLVRICSSHSQFSWDE
jgi:hypothetical protein